jgi:glycosyltransferase involved in cell wall biosynthesis
MGTQPPTVLHVIPSLDIGGAERMLTSLVMAKRKEPLSQIVVSLISGGALAEKIRTAGIPVHEFGVDNPLALPFALFRIAALIRRTRPVAIQSWLYYADLAGLWSLKLSGRRSTTRLYWGVRSSDMDQKQYPASLSRAIRACARRAAEPDAVVANSYAGRDVHRRLGFRPRAFPVIPNGIDAVAFKPDPTARARMRAKLGIRNDKAVVIHVARADPMKDHASLAAVAAGLPDVHFLMIGLGTEGIRGPANLQALGARHDLPALYPVADVALSTSAFGEGFPNVIAEAMACGVPVVATDVGDSRRIVDDTGIVVRPRDVESMKSAIGKLLGMPAAERENRAVAARARVVTLYSLDRAVAAFDALHLRGILPASATDH